MIEQQAMRVYIDIYSMTGDTNKQPHQNPSSSI